MGVSILDLDIERRKRHHYEHALQVAIRGSNIGVQIELMDLPAKANNKLTFIECSYNHHTLCME